MKLFFIRPGTQAWNFTKKDISCEVCKMFQNNLFTETLKSIVSDDFWFENVFCRGKEAIAGKFSVKKVYFKLLQNFTRKTAVLESFFFNKVAGLRQFKAYNFIKKETPTQLLFCEFYKSCFTEHVRWPFVGVYLRPCQASRIGNF